MPPEICCTEVSGWQQKKNPKLSKCRELCISGALRHKWKICTSTSLRSRNHPGEKGTKTVIITGKGWSDLNNVFSTWQDHYSHEYTASMQNHYTHEYTISMVTWARTAQKSSSQHFSMVQKGGSQSSTLTVDTMDNWQLLWMKESVSTKSMDSGGPIRLQKMAPHREAYGQHKLYSIGYLWGKEDMNLRRWEQMWEELSCMKFSINKKHRFWKVLSTLGDCLILPIALENYAKELCQNKQAIDFCKEKYLFSPLFLSFTPSLHVVPRIHTDPALESSLFQMSVPHKTKAVTYYLVEWLLKSENNALWVKKKNPLRELWHPSISFPFNNNPAVQERVPKCHFINNRVSKTLGKVFPLFPFHLVTASENWGSTKGNKGVVNALPTSIISYKRYMARGTAQNSIHLNMSKAS